MRVCIQIVTFNHEATVVATIASAYAQRSSATMWELELRILDNGSTDQTSERIQLAIADHPTPTFFERRNENIGFCAAHNYMAAEAMATGADFIVLLNPDLILQPDAVDEMISHLIADSTAAAATPRLYRANPDLTLNSPPVFDAAGMYMTPAMRHFDRGSGEIDRGQYRLAQYVFGGTGAALTLRREAILDLQNAGHEGKLLNELFFAYREDAELAWRLQRMGWNIRYVPQAVGYHVRRVLPTNRSTLPPQINALGVQNRFLLQLLHLRCSHPLRVLFQTTVRNIIVIIGVLTRERSSRIAFSSLRKMLPEAREIRRSISANSRIPVRFESRWLRTEPYTEPALARRKHPQPIKSAVAIIVNYRSGEHLVTCINSLLRSASSLEGQIRLNIIVVDNSEDPSGRATAETFVDEPRLYWMFPEKNLGFSGGINRALKHVKSDAVLILNPDIQIDGQAITQLSSALARYENLSLIAPVLTNADGTPQHGFFARRFPTLSSTLAELFFVHRLWPNNLWTTRSRYEDDPRLRDLAQGSHFLGSWQADEAYVVEQPAGACMMLRTDDLMSFGGMNERYYPAWFEDVDLNRRIRDAGQVSAILPNAKAVHRGGYSKEIIGDTKFNEIFTRNMFRYWERYGTGIELGLIRTAVTLTSWIRTRFGERKGPGRAAAEEVRKAAS